MKFDVENVSAVKKKISIVMPDAKVREKFNKAYNMVRRSAKINGFRPGKAPRSVLEKHYGGQVMDDVLNDILKEAYPKVIEKEGLEPVSYPEYGGEELKEGEDFAFSLSVDVRPQIEPKGYEGIELKQEKVEVKPEEINAELEKKRKELAVSISVEEGSVEKGDTVLFDFEGFVDDKPIENGKAEGSSLEIGSGQFIPGFEDGLIGMKLGDKGEVRPKFPDDYQAKEYAGKEALFKVFIKEIKRPELHALDDEFAKDAGDYKTLAEFKEKITKDLMKGKEDEAKRAMHQELRDIILKNNDFEVPLTMVESQLKHKNEEMKKQMSQYGMDEDTVEKHLAMSRDEMYKDAEEVVKSGLLLDAIAKKEKITVDQTDVENYYREMSEGSGRPVEEVKSYFEGKGDYIKSNIKDMKIISFLISKAKIK